jgi:hypothetical protein
MAPEQVWGGELGPPADVWGIGVVLWEAASAEAAFGGDADVLPSSSSEDLPPELHPQVQRPADPVGQHRDLPRELAHAIDGALAANAADRPSVAELAELLVTVPDVVSPRARPPS